MRLSCAVFFCLVGDIDGLLVGKNRGFDITCLPHVGEIEIVRDQIPTSAPPTPYWGGGGGVGLGIDRCISYPSLNEELLKIVNLPILHGNTVLPTD